MQGVTTAIVAFVFVCLVYPHLVKHKPQFYSALVLILVVILFDAIAHMFGTEAISRVMYVLSALVQILTIMLLVLCVGGLSVDELRGEMAHAIEVIRRGETKPVLVPLRGEQPREREAPAPPAPDAVSPPKDDASIPLG